MELLRRTLWGSALILLILLLRSLWKNRLPSLVFRVLWIVAALRLLLPLSVALPVSINYAPLPSFEVPAATGQPLAWESALPLYGAEQHDISSAAVSPWMLLWLAGTVLFTAYFLISYVRCLRTFRSSLPESSPEVQAWLAEHRLLRRFSVRYSDQIASPLTYGILFPVILLPKALDRRDTATLQFVLTHEWVHIRRWDALVKLLFAATLALHWFNPLAWLLYWLGNRDLELSCDADVIRWVGWEYRAAYALALLELEEKRSGLLPCFSRFSKDFLEERVKSIMQFKRVSAVTAFLAMLLVVGITSAFAFRPETTAQIQLNDSVEMDESISGKSNVEQNRDYYPVVTQWAEALKDRDGKARYTLLSADAQDPYYKALVVQNGTTNPWTIGVSSPWVVNYEIALDGAEAVITYHTKTSDQEIYIYQEVLTLTEDDGQDVVQNYGVTVDYLREDLYEKALDIQAQVLEGHLTWRLNSESVAMNFLRNTLGVEKGTLRTVTDLEIEFETEDEETIRVQLYRPLNVESGFLAVYSYSIENQYQILDNLGIY